MGITITGNASISGLDDEDVSVKCVVCLRDLKEIKPGIFMCVNPDCEMFEKEKQK